MTLQKYHCELIHLFFKWLKKCVICSLIHEAFKFFRLFNRHLDKPSWKVRVHNLKAQFYFSCATQYMFLSSQGSLLCFIKYSTLAAFLAQLHYCILEHTVCAWFTFGFPCSSFVLLMFFIFSFICQPLLKIEYPPSAVVPNQGYGVEGGAGVSRKIKDWNVFSHKKTFFKSIFKCLVGHQAFENCLFETSKLKCLIKRSSLDKRC